MADYGIKVAKPGVDAGTADLGNLIFHSAYPVLKIKEMGRGTVTYTHDDGAGTTVLVTTHNLGYEPLFKFMTQWYDVDNGTLSTTFRNAPFIDALADGAVNFIARPFVGTAQLSYTVSSYDGMGTQSVNLAYIYAVYYDPDADI